MIICDGLADEFAERSRTEPDPIHDRLYLQGEPIDLLPHDVWPHHVPIEAGQREVTSGTSEVIATADLGAQGAAPTVNEGTALSAPSQEKSKKPRRRKAPGSGAAFASDIYCAEILVSKLAGRFRFYHASEQWFRRDGSRWLMAAPTELAEICKSALEDIAREAETLPAYLRRSSAVADVLDLASINYSISRAGYRPPLQGKH